jgi:hypothetical protein
LSGCVVRSRRASVRSLADAARSCTAVAVAAWHRSALTHVATCAEVTIGSCHLRRSLRVATTRAAARRTNWKSCGKFASDAILGTRGFDGDRAIQRTMDKPMQARRTLAEQSVEELLGRAAEMDAMAATATTMDVRHSLEKLALRFRALAEDRRLRGDNRSD